MGLQEWFYHYFIEPMVVGYGFNIVNTLTYGIILMGFVYVVFEILKKLKIRIDEFLVLALLPFILLGISIRIFEDAGILKGFIFMTPGIWFLFFGITFSILLLSVVFQRKAGTPYYKFMIISGFLLFGPTLGVIGYKNLLALKYILFWILPFLVLLKFVRWSSENKLVTVIHFFDSVVTFVSINYFGYVELHVLPRFVINMTGTVLSFIFLKLIVVVSVMLLLDKYSDDKKFKNYLKLIIGILGFVPGMRDFLRLMWLV